MKALISYSPSEPKLKGLAEGIARGLEGQGNTAELMEVSASDRPLSMGMYDLLIVGSPSLGFWGGKVAEDIAVFIRRCSRLEGKKVAAFVPAGGFGVSKSLTALMKLAEAQGAIVVDFAALGSEKHARTFGSKFRV